MRIRWEFFEQVIFGEINFMQHKQLEVPCYLEARQMYQL